MLIHETYLLLGSVTLLASELSTEERSAMRKDQTTLTKKLKSAGHAAMVGSFPGFIKEVLPQKLYHYQGDMAFFRLKFRPDTSELPPGQMFQHGRFLNINGSELPFLK